MFVIIYVSKQKINGGEWKTPKKDFFFFLEWGKCMKGKMLMGVLFKR